MPDAPVEHVRRRWLVRVITMPLTSIPMAALVENRTTLIPPKVQECTPLPILSIESIRISRATAAQQIVRCYQVPHSPPARSLDVVDALAVKNWRILPIVESGRSAVGFHENAPAAMIPLLSIGGEVSAKSLRRSRSLPMGRTGRIAATGRRWPIGGFQPCIVVDPKADACITREITRGLAGDFNCFRVICPVIQGPEELIVGGC